MIDSLSLVGIERKPVPPQPEIGKDPAYKTVQINTEHPKHKEKLVIIEKDQIDGENHYWAMKNRPVGAIPFLLVRKSLLYRLLVVDSLLIKDKNVRLYIKDGWRPLQVQRSAYEYQKAKLRNEYPDWPEQKILAYMSKWFAKIPNEEDLLFYPPPHTTGAAIDVVLKSTVTGELVYMGPGKDRKEPDFFEREEEKRDLSREEKEAQTNRRILYWAMRKVGFICSVEYWHFSHEDRASAFLTGKKEAIYGYIEDYTKYL